MYRRRLVVIISIRLIPAGWRGTIVSILVVGRWRSVRGRWTRLCSVVMM